ncbi:MAG: type II secretion system protein [Deltaproteobacteria bacterium]|nr:type II secretion system protein [Deltaproteobacteria bacterium]
MLNKVLKKAKSKKGFTLIELIVVISILAILALLIVPRIMGFIGTARQNATNSNARLLYNAAILAISADEITLPTETNAECTTLADVDALATGEDQDGLSGFLDEWPKDGDGKPLRLVISPDGEVDVEDSEVATGEGNNLAGKDL